MARLFSNNASTTLSVAALPSDTILSIATGTGVKFNTNPLGYNHELVTISNQDGSLFEIVQVNRKDAGTDALYDVTRGREGTTAQSWPIGSKVEGRLTKNSLVDGLIAVTDDFNGSAYQHKSLKVSGIGTSNPIINANSKFSMLSVVGFNVNTTDVATSTVLDLLSNNSVVNDSMMIIPVSLFMVLYTGTATVAPILQFGHSTNGGTTIASVSLTTANTAMTKGVVVRYDFPSGITVQTGSTTNYVCKVNTTGTGAGIINCGLLCYYAPGYL
jgi:hypothetical protein